MTIHGLTRMPWQDIYDLDLRVKIFNVCEDYFMQIENDENLFAALAEFGGRYDIDRLREIWQDMYEEAYNDLREEGCTFDEVMTGMEKERRSFIAITLEQDWN